MTDFTKIKSKYVKNKIKNLKMTGKNERYIYDLMSIELLILGEYVSTGTGYIAMGMKEKYPKEWDIIGKELNPKHITLKQEREKEAKEDKKIAEENKKEEQKKKRESEKTWKLAGGK